MKNPEFSDPYRLIPLESKTRFVSMVSQEDYDTLKAIRPTKGTMQTVINLALKYLINECHRRKIEPFTGAARFEQLCVDSFVHPRRTFADVVSVSNGPNDTGAVPLGDCTYTDPKDLSSNTKRSAKSRSGRKGRKDSKTT